jgi:hypothetical protein
MLLVRNSLLDNGDPAIGVGFWISDQSRHLPPDHVTVLSYTEAMGLGLALQHALGFLLAVRLDCRPVKLATGVIAKKTGPVSTRWRQYKADLAALCPYNSMGLELKRCGSEIKIAVSIPDLPTVDLDLSQLRHLGFDLTRAAEQASLDSILLKGTIDRSHLVVIHANRLERTLSRALTSESGKG